MTCICLTAFGRFFLTYLRVAFLPRFHSLRVVLIASSVNGSSAFCSSERPSRRSSMMPNMVFLAILPPAAESTTGGFAGLSMRRSGFAAPREQSARLIDRGFFRRQGEGKGCLLYTSDAADE